MRVDVGFPGLGEIRGIESNLDALRLKSPFKRNDRRRGADPPRNESGTTDARYNVRNGAFTA
jgi:hypothetical protein